MSYSFTDIFDIPSLTRLCESYTETNGVVTALLDLQGNVHIKTGWQDICTQFHRVNPTSAKRCTESDTHLAGQLAAGKKYNVYRCQNGLVDVAVPVIVDGEHVANFFTGQFLFEEADQEHFRRQGETLGYDLIPYMDALNRVPVFNEEEIRKIIDFLVCLAQIMGEMGKSRLDLLNMQKLQQEKVLELEGIKNKLETLAAEDPLTGLYNRRSFNRRLNEEFSRAKRYRHDLSVAMIDVDFFKVINDTYGHAAGDEILIAVANTLMKNVRSSDFVARLGGDEFCIIFPEMSSKNSLAVLEKIRALVHQIKIPQTGTLPSLTCSIGLAQVRADYTSADMLLINADKALYQSKSQGRNCSTEFLDTGQMVD